MKKYRNVVLRYPIRWKCKISKRTKYDGKKRSDQFYIFIPTEYNEFCKDLRKKNKEVEVKVFE